MHEFQGESRQRKDMDPVGWALGTAWASKSQAGLRFACAGPAWCRTQACSEFTDIILKLGAPILAVLASRALLSHIGSA